jgi:hypothetical protein
VGVVGVGVVAAAAAAAAAAATRKTVTDLPHNELQLILIHTSVIHIRSRQSPCANVMFNARGGGRQQRRINLHQPRHRD